MAIAGHNGEYGNKYCSVCKYILPESYKVLSLVRREKCSSGKPMIIRRNVLSCLKHSDDEVLNYFGVERDL